MCQFLSMQNDCLSPTFAVWLTRSIFFLTRLPPNGVQAGSQLRCVYMLCLIEVWGLYFSHKSCVLLISHIIELEATSVCHLMKFRHIGSYSLWFYHALGFKFSLCVYRYIPNSCLFLLHLWASLLFHFCFNNCYFTLQHLSLNLAKTDEGQLWMAHLPTTWECPCCSK